MWSILIARRLIHRSNLIHSRNGCRAAHVQPLNISKVLIANRGEIACRVIRTASNLGIKTVSVYSDVDKHALHVKSADYAYFLGPASATESYLNQDKIIEVAKRSGAQAIHPGYGFLSENAEFADLCQRNDIIFIGPKPHSIRDMGIKSTSKEIMERANVPVVPGYHGSNQDDSFLFEKAKEIGFPVMIKAVRGGGGKGMRIVLSEEEFLSQLDSARRESSKSFGDTDVLIEKFIENPRHVEVQVFGDLHGNYVYLFERDCSVQRRHQKIIEEAPGPGITAGIRKSLGEVAVKAATAVQYVGAGTVEFIFDPKNEKFYFMEMNTRLQVEHPVTEMITNTDLVEWQFRVASGQRLPLLQEDLKLNGHAFEARIYAEDPESGFIPGAGHIKRLALPSPGPDIRIETGTQSGDVVSVHYDPMIAKLVVWGPDRLSALLKLKINLAKYNIMGLKTNIDFLMKLTSNEDFRAGNVYTDFIRDKENDLFPTSKPVHSKVVCVAVLQILAQQKMVPPANQSSPYGLPDAFRIGDVVKPTHELSIKCGDSIYSVRCTKDSTETYRVQVNENDVFDGVQICQNNEEVVLLLNDECINYRVLSDENSVCVYTDDGSYEFDVMIPSYLKSQSSESSDSAQEFGVVAPMPGVIEKVLVKEGQSVEPGEALVVMMAMKMEYVIKSSKRKIIDKILFKAGDNVQKGVQIVKFKSD